jgi:uncharacterized repeat protein (TIGR01451 family)
VYSSSNTNVATIPSYGDAPGGGTATARGEGDATITVSRTEPGDGAGCNKTANAVISVNPVPAPAFEVDGNLSFFAYRNDPLPTPQFLTIRNTGNVILPFTVATNTTIYNQSLSNTNPLGNSDPLSVTVPVGGSWDVYYQPKSTASAGTSFVWNLSFNSNSSAGTKTKTALYTVSQPPQNLTLNCGSITPSILQSVDQGDTALWTVPYTQAGLSTPILFSISALEGSTSTGSTTATPPPASGSQTVSITTTASTPTTPNPHSLVIRAISGTISRTCNVSLEVLPSPPPPPCTLASLIIDPVGGPNLSIGGTRNYAVTAYYNNGNPPANVKNSGQTLYSSSNTSVATILSPGGGNATAVGNGTATITVTRQEPGEPVGCSKSAEALINVGDPANLDLSDKDLIKVNNNSTSAGTSAQQCSGVSEVFSLPNQGIFKTGDVVRFKINVCNSGGQQLTNVRVVDTTTNLANLTYLSSSNNCVTNANDATGTYILANVPAESGGVPAVCSFELRATVASPGGPAGSWYRFQNVATITSDQVTKTVRTPPYLFSAGAGVPNRNETAP